MSSRRIDPGLEIILCVVLAVGLFAWLAAWLVLLVAWVLALPLARIMKREVTTFWPQHLPVPDETSNSPFKWRKQ